MEGVTILAEEMIYTWPAGVTTMIFISLILFVCGIIFAMVFSEINFISSFFLIVIMLSLITFIGSIIYGDMNEIHDYIQYKVLVDDKVNLNEFLNKYEILGQEGQIYTIKEIEE